MHKRYIISALIVSVMTISCSTRQGDDRAAFSREDFITENYLAYQDSLVHAWNLMMSDDNEKLAGLHLLISELRSVNVSEDQSTLQKFDDRLRQLRHIRYTQKSMANSDVIEEYDFASTALVREVLTTAEMSTEYAGNTRLQLLVDQIRLAEERIENYRADYDDLVSHYNTFLDANRRDLVQLSRDSIQKKPRFQLVSID
ncbi:MAG: hypothetical protein QM762_22620 [Chryseolinea sp.]